jgi:hypothetical protein
VKTFADCSLVTIKLKQGWAIKHHSFFNEPFLLEDGSVNPFHNDSPDLLLLHQTEKPENQKLSIDVGWHFYLATPDTLDYTRGYFKLTIYRNKWQDVLFMEMIPDLTTTIARIHHWMLQDSVFE